MILAKVWSILFSLIGFHSYHSGIQFVSYDKFWLTVNRSIFNTIYLFNADVFGQALFTPSTLVKLLNVAVFGTALTATGFFLIKGTPWQRFFALQLPFLYLVYTVSGFATDVSTARYLILTPFYFVILLYFTSNTLWQKRNRRLSIALVALITLTWIANSLSSAYWVAVGVKRSGIGARPRNQIERQIAGIVRDKKISRGYATYGYANLIDYFSKYEATVTPIYCTSHKIQPFYLLMSDQELDIKAQKSFVVSVEQSLSNTVSEPYPALNLPANMSYACPKNIVEKVFGKANEKIDLGSGVEIHIYNQDVANRIQSKRRFRPLSPID